MNLLHKKCSYNDIKDYKKEIFRDGLQWSTKNRGRILIQLEIAKEVILIMHKNLILLEMKMYFTCKKYFKIKNQKKGVFYFINLCRIINMGKRKESKHENKKTTWRHN